MISPIVSSLEGMGLIFGRKLVLSPMTGEIVIMDADKSKRGDMTYSYQVSVALNFKSELQPITMVSDLRFGKAFFPPCKFWP